MSIIKKIARKYKISKITNSPINGIDGEIISFIKDWLSNLVIFHWDKKPNYIHFMNIKGQLVLVELDGLIFIRWFDFWKVLEVKYNLTNSDMQIIFKLIIKDMVKYNFKDIKAFQWTQNTGVEDAYLMEMQSINKKSLF